MGVYCIYKVLYTKVLHIIFYFFIILCELSELLTPKTIEILLPFIAFICFAFLSRNKSVWIGVVIRCAIEERHYPSHRMSREDDEEDTEEEHCESGHCCFVALLAVLCVSRWCFVASLRYFVASWGYALL